MLQLSVVGYPFVNPGPVGGINLNLTKPNIDEEFELYVRWYQLNTFLPVLHFLKSPVEFSNAKVSLVESMLFLKTFRVIEIFQFLIILQ